MIVWVTRSGGLKAWHVAEQRVQSLYSRLDPAWRAGPDTVQVPYQLTLASGESFVRRHDLVLRDGTRVEVKSGFRRGRGTRQPDPCEQARRDSLIRDDPASDVPAVIWHFVGSPSTRPGSEWEYGLGPDADLLGCLERYRIPFVIHPPG